MSRQVVSGENSFTNANGKKIFTKYWKPSDEPRALVFICHGFGGHSSRYEAFGTALTEQGYLAFSHDHIGHGHSEGERVQVDDFSHYVRDVLQHIDEVAADNTGIPIFMFGYSMGGTIAILSVLKRPSFFTGAVFSAPAVQPGPAKISSCLVFLGRIAAFVAPSYQIKPPVDPSQLSRDPVQVEKYANDPLVWHEGLKAKWTAKILEAMNDIQRNVSKITLPYLLIHGDDDQVVLIDGSHFLQQHSSSTDKTFKVYEGGRHELLNEIQELSSKVLQDILDWIKQKLQ
ncbi:monoglyceride lipase-like [Montipora capricornis]|uniref:monoglyceride lipase-like n=1 Tax=Montipora capricornis TaxID=246305 RepID=UPI0035F11C86